MQRWPKDVNVNIKKKKKSRMVCIAMLPFVAPKKDGKSV